MTARYGIGALAFGLALACGGGDGPAAPANTAGATPNATDRAPSSSDAPPLATDPPPSASDPPSGSTSPPSGGGTSMRDPICVRICNRASANGCELDEELEVDCAAVCTSELLSEECGPENAAAYDCIFGLGYCLEDFEDEQVAEALLQSCRNEIDRSIACGEVPPAEPVPGTDGAQ